VATTVTAVAFCGFLIAFIAIGLWSATRRRETTEDYLVASRNIGPLFIALSAVATNNSGFMFMGLIGATFESGIRAMWLMVGWVLGDWLAWFFVHGRVRVLSERAGATTLPGWLASGLRGHRAVAAVAGLITLGFLGLYAAAQLTASGKAFHHVFGWDIELAAVLGAIIVAAYCIAGGIRASIWTDVAQSFVMLGAMIALLGVALVELGGPAALWSALERIDPELVELAPGDYKFGFVGYLVGWLGAGLGVVGQPHVMIRAMAIDSPDHVARARRIYVLWYLMFSAACIGVGLAARVLVEGPLADAELALPVLSDQLFPSVLVGLMLAGVFAATISTADSQVLSCSAAITQDLAPRWGRSYRNVKLATLGVTGFALVLALQGERLGVFGLVTIAWSSLAAGLGPLVIVRAFGWPVDARCALATMLGGIATALAWRYALAWHGDLYDALPGMIGGLVTYAVLRPRTGNDLERGTLM
jgi:sodium/proline symporter